MNIELFQPRRRQYTALHRLDLAAADLVGVV